MRNIVSPLDGIRSPFGRASGASVLFDPAILFAASEQGFWLDPSDISTLFQDSAGTTPVTADGDPVGRISDKSGRGNHFIQATSAARPTYRVSGGVHWLDLDGVDDHMTCSVDANTIFGVTLADLNYYACFGGRYSSLTTNSADPFANHGLLHDAGGYISSYARSSGVIGWYHWDTAVRVATSSYAAGDDFVHEGRRDVAGSLLYSSLNGGAESSVSASALSGGATTLLLGRRLGVYMTGRFYGAVVRSAVTDLSTRGEVRDYMAVKSGVTL
jgi:hypothetical protein